MALSREIIEKLIAGQMKTGGSFAKAEASKDEILSTAGINCKHDPNKPAIMLDAEFDANGMLILGDSNEDDEVEYDETFYGTGTMEPAVHPLCMQILPDNLKMQADTAIPINEIDTESMSEREADSFNISMASTEDTVTKRLSLKKNYLSDRHVRIAKQLIESLVDYISDSIPKAAKMEPEQFFSFITSYYNDSFNKLKGDEFRDEREWEMGFKQLTFGDENTQALVDALSAFIDSPEDPEKVTRLKNVCDMLLGISNKMNEENSAIYRNLAGALLDEKVVDKMLSTFDKGQK